VPVWHFFKKTTRPGDPKKFGDVVAKLEHIPSWMAASKQQSMDASIVSLRPPKLPSGMGPESDDKESVAPSRGSDRAASTLQEIAANDIEYPADWYPNMNGEGPDTGEDAEAFQSASLTSSVPVASAMPVPVISLPAPPRRPDTLIDDLIPRADEEAVAAIRDAVQGLLAARETVFAESEREVIELARLVAERVIARELSLDPSVITGLVREGLSALSIKDRVVIRLGSFFDEVCPEVRASVARLGIEAQVEIDPSVGIYGCVIQTEWGQVDESIEQRLRTMLERLSVLPPKPTTARR
jgi:hypothetical protein